MKESERTIERLIDENARLRRLIVDLEGSDSGVQRKEDTSIDKLESLDAIQLLSQIGIWSYDIIRQKLIWSEGMFRLWGLDPNLGTPEFAEHQKYIHKDDFRLFDNAVREAVEQGKPFELELRICRPDGEERTIITTSDSKFDSSGQVIGLFGTNQDITKRKQAAIALAHSHDLMSYVIEHFQGGVAIHDKDLNYIYVSQRYLHDYKVKEKDIIGKHHYDVFPDLPQKWREVHQKALAGVISSADNDPYYRDDGTMEWTRWECRPWYESDGSIGGIIIYTEVITDRKQAELELIETKEKAEANKKHLDSIINNIADPVFVKDQQSRLLIVNEAFCTLFGLSKGDIIGKTLAEDVTPEEMNSFLKIDRQVLADGVPNINEETLTVRGGETQILSTRKTRFIDENGKRFLVGVIRDITEHQQTELELIKAKEKAEESDRLKSSFLANMSHEIRTPMNSVLGFSELLKEPGLSGEDQKNYISIIETSGERLLHTINSLIEISKLEAGETHISLSEVIVSEALEYVFELFKPEADSNKLSFSYLNSVPESELIITTDKEKLYGILINLVKNAIKYTNKGFIEFGFEKKDDCIEFCVKDTGIGIAEDQQRTIFERFIQVEMDEVRTIEGSGLGLAITKANVELLGGTIWVESEEGHGSQFYFTIPNHAKTKT